MPELAILGGSKNRTKPYPEWPVWDERDIQAVTEVVRSGHWGGYPYPGLKTAEPAKKFAELQGGGYTVPMINGAATMEVALRAAASVGGMKSSSQRIRSMQRHPPQCRQSQEGVDHIHAEICGVDNFARAAFKEHVVRDNNRRLARHIQDILDVLDERYPSPILEEGWEGN